MGRLFLGFWPNGEMRGSCSYSTAREWLGCLCSTRYKLAEMIDYRHLLGKLFSLKRCYKVYSTYYHFGQGPIVLWFFAFFEKEDIIEIECGRGSTAVF